MSNIPTCTVLAVVRDSEGGEPVVGAKITAVLSGFEVDSGYVTPHTTTSVTDLNGECTLLLWPNQRGQVESFYDIKIESLRKSVRLTAVVPELPTANLWEISTLPPYPGMADGTAILAQVLAALATTLDARDDAVDAAASATASAATAANAASTATTQAGIATTQAGIATTAATNAGNSATLAQSWAIKTDGPVSGGEYSAKYWAQSIAGGPVASWVGLTGAINLTQARTALNITNVDNTSDANKPVSTAQAASIATKVSTTTFTSAMALKADLVGGTVPANQLPSYVDDVLEFANLAAFPGTGETGKIYVALDTNKVYRWGGSAYTEISPSPGSTDAVPEGSTNLYFTPARVLATVLAGISFATNAAITAGDAVLSALGKLQKQITDLITVVSGKSDTTTTVTKDSSTGAANMPAGTTAQRGASTAGRLRYSTTLGRWEGANGALWGSLGGATGGGVDAVFYESDANVTTDYTIPSGRNAMAAGPITVAAGASITIPAGSTLTIV